MLPPELRNRIYEEVLSSAPDPIVVRWCDPKCSSPSLLRTCRKIRDEASGFYYGNNTFKFAHVDLPTRWVGALGRKHQSMIRAIFLATGPYGGVRSLDEAKARLDRTLGDWTRRGFAIPCDAVLVHTTTEDNSMFWESQDLNLEEVKRMISERDSR